MKKILTLAAIAIFIACKKEEPAKPVKPVIKQEYNLIYRDSTTNLCFYQTLRAQAMFIIPVIVCLPCDSVINKNN